MQRRWTTTVGDCPMQSQTLSGRVSLIIYTYTRFFFLFGELFIRRNKTVAPCVVLFSPPFVVTTFDAAWHIRATISTAILHHQWQQNLYTRVWEMIANPYRESASLLRRFRRFLWHLMMTIVTFFFFSSTDGCWANGPRAARRAATESRRAIWPASKRSPPRWRWESTRPLASMQLRRFPGYAIAIWATAPNGTPPNGEKYEYTILFFFFFFFFFTQTQRLVCRDGSLAKRIEFHRFSSLFLWSARPVAAKAWDTDAFSARALTAETSANLTVRQLKGRPAAIFAIWALARQTPGSLPNGPARYSITSCLDFLLFFLLFFPRNHYNFGFPCPVFGRMRNWYPNSQSSLFLEQWNWLRRYQETRHIQDLRFGQRL